MPKYTYTTLKTVEGTEHKYDVIMCDQTKSLGLISYFKETEAKFLPEGVKEQWDEGVDVDVMDELELANIAGLIFGIAPE